jgi:chromosome segregation ATPase
MSDQYDAAVEESLPCLWDCKVTGIAGDHNPLCPAFFRFSSAARMRELVADADRKLKEDIKAVPGLFDLYIKLENEAIDHKREMQAKDAEIKRLKKLVQKEAGFNAERCTCVFAKADDSPPAIECGYHQEQRAEIERLSGGLTSVNKMVDDFEGRVSPKLDRAISAYQSMVKQRDDLRAEIEQLKTLLREAMPILGGIGSAAPLLDRIMNILSKEE